MKNLRTILQIFVERREDSLMIKERKKNIRVKRSAPRIYDNFNNIYAHFKT